MEVSPIDQNPIVNVKLSRFFNMPCASFMVDAFENVVDMVVYCSHSVKPFFCGRAGEFVGVIEVYGAWIKAIETSIREEFVGSGRCSVVGKFCER